jgi:maltodextrin utilization protein YvdJ
MGSRYHEMLSVQDDQYSISEGGKDAKGWLVKKSNPLHSSRIVEELVGSVDHEQIPLHAVMLINATLCVGIALCLSTFNLPEGGQFFLWKSALRSAKYQGLTSLPTRQGPSRAKESPNVEKSRFSAQKI